MEANMCITIEPGCYIAQYGKTEKKGAHKEKWSLRAKTSSNLREPFQKVFLLTGKI